MRDLGKTGLRCHPMGFGCYRIQKGNETHEAALRAYLDRGGNVIDTSANYTDGLSEALVGLVLRDYRRDGIVIVTKGGYIQGKNMALARERNFPEVVRYGEGIWHCIHPDFLRTQVEGSLGRLRIEKIDIYLLHNPEYFLADRAHNGPLNDGDHEEFYRRIGRAFDFLEGEVERGRIGWYGVSSNNFGLPEADASVTSVRKCLDEARSIRQDHHFRVVQLPLNLWEPGGALEKNNDGRTALEFCREQGLGVLINRPLNAFSGNRMIRLADFQKPGDTASPADALAALLAPLGEHEQRIARELQIGLCSGGAGVAGLLADLVPRLDSTGHWEMAAGQYVILPVQTWLAGEQQRVGCDMRWQAWVEQYIRMLNRTLEDIGRYLSHKEQVVSDEQRARLFRAGYPRTDASLSRMVMNVLAGLPGLTCILNGMRRSEYVEDAMGVPSLPPVDGLAILEGFQR